MQEHIQTCTKGLWGSTKTPLHTHTHMQVTREDFENILKEIWHSWRGRQTRQRSLAEFTWNVLKCWTSESEKMCLNDNDGRVKEGETTFIIISVMKWFSVEFGRCDDSKLFRYKATGFLSVTGHHVFVSLRYGSACYCAPLWQQSVDYFTGQTGVRNRSGIKAETPPITLIKTLFFWRWQYASTLPVSLWWSRSDLRVDNQQHSDW